MPETFRTDGLMSAGNGRLSSLFPPVFLRTPDRMNVLPVHPSVCFARIRVIVASAGMHSQDSEQPWMELA